MIDPLERWREIGLDDKPDYAGPAHVRGAAVHARSGRPRGRRRRDRRRTDGRPHVGPAGNPLRAPRDPRRGLSSRAPPRGEDRRDGGAPGDRLRRRGGAPLGSRQEPCGDRADGRPGRRGGSDPDRPRRRSLDHRARREGRWLRRTARSRSSTSTPTRTRARRCSVSRSRTGRRCTGSCATGTSTGPATCRSACAATGRARRSSPGRPSTASRASSCTTSATAGSAPSSSRRSRSSATCPTFLTVDVDVLDPAFAPGTGTPEPGGMTSADLLWACRELAARLQIVGMDVVEVIPTGVASADITALVAERIVRETLTGIAVRRSARPELRRAARRTARSRVAATTPVADAAIGLEARIARSGAPRLQAYQRPSGAESRRRGRAAHADDAGSLWPALVLGDDHQRDDCDSDQWRSSEEPSVYLDSAEDRSDRLSAPPGRIGRLQRRVELRSSAPVMRRSMRDDRLESPR